MSEPAIDIERLKKITKRAQKPVLKRQAEFKEAMARKVEEDAKCIAEETIKKIPSVLEEEARKGNNHAQVMGNIINDAEKKAAEIVVAYCKEQKLEAKILHYSAGSDDLYGSHYYIIVSW